MEDKIVEALKLAGGRLIRQKLWEKLPDVGQKPTDDYWKAEQTLVDARKIERRRGRNGGIYLVPETNDEPALVEIETIPSSASAAELDPQTERHFYDPALNVILRNWTEQPGFTHVFGAVTAGQGRRQTGGTWTRPDITLCTVSDWLFSSRPEGDVRTIEVKRYEALNVMGVYEAVSHRLRAHYAYLLIVNFPTELSEDEKGDFDNVLSVAGRHGIGVITATSVEKWSTWSFELDPLRSDADNQAVHQFLLDQVPPDVRGKFREAIRSIKITI
ncbi:hypothetical protein [Caulobacter sp.]|uniref:hypothetical protein n=1 Tax=Caulobacter sp. TaxID=78 RepID=UPI0031CE0323